MPDPVAATPDKDCEVRRIDCNLVKLEALISLSVDYNASMVTPLIKMTKYRRFNPTQGCMIQRL